MELVHGGEISVYRYTEALPRAYMVGQYQVEPDLARRRTYMTQGFALDREVVLEERPVGRVGAGGTAEIVRYENERVEVALETRDGGILILADTYFPGWRVYVDGIEHALLQANHVFRAVLVPAGARTVVFSYKPDSFSYGLAISAGAALLWVTLLLVRRRLPFPDITPLSADAGSTLNTFVLQGVLVALLHAWATQGEAWSAWLERVRLGLGS